MRIEISQIEKDAIYSVNGIEVLIDSEGRLSAQTELSDKEKRALQIYKKSVLENPSFKGNHPKATYVL